MNTLLTMSAESFAPILRRLRERSGLSQSELAERSGISVRTIQGYEIAAREPKWSHVCALAKGLKVKLEAFRV